MKGSIRKKGNGRWYVATHHRDHTTGKWAQKAHGGYGTKREAEAVLREVLTRMDRGSFIEPSHMTLGAYMTDEWLPSKRDLRPSTRSSYESILANHIGPRIGAVPIQKVTPGTLRTFYAELAAGGRRDGSGGGLSDRTVRYIHMILKQALAAAVDDRLLTTNPAASKRVTPPSPKKAEMVTWTAAEVHRFLTTTAKHRLHAAFVLAATTGMRRGEVLGLRWQDVNLDERQVVIRQALTTVHYEIHIGPPKTENSRRTLSIPAETVDALRAHRKRQAEERLAFGPGYVDSGLVFTAEDGAPTHPDSFAHVFMRLRDKAKVRPIRFHGVRHTYATLALEAGVPPKIVSTRLGHSSVAFTLDVYTHAVPAMDADAADAVAGLIYRPDGTGTR